MRGFIIGFVVFLSACNGGTTNVPYTDQELSAKVDALTQALADATHAQAEQAASIKKLSIIGKVHGIISAERVLAIGKTAEVAPDFGPCPDMGVLIGRGSSNFTADSLAAPVESFQQCTGYEYSVDMATHTLAMAPRIFFTDTTCGADGGSMVEWPSGGGAYNDQTLQQGIVFTNPLDGVTRLVVEAQQPQSMEFKSVWVVSNPGCQPDDETRNVYLVRAVTPQDNFGIPFDFGNFQLGSP